MATSTTLNAADIKIIRTYQFCHCRSSFSIAISMSTASLVLESESSKNYFDKFKPTPASKPKSNKDYLCFMVMTTCCLATVGFYQGIADKAIGQSNNSITIILFSQYAIELLINFTTTYWTKWLSYSQRIALCSLLFMIGFIISAVLYDTSSQLQADTILHGARLSIIGCVMLNAMAALICEISLMQYVAFYDQRCINAVSTGGGLGAVIGAALAFSIEIDAIPKLVSFGLCILLPINLFIFYFYFLPYPILLITEKRKSVISKLELEMDEDAAMEMSAFAAFKRIIIKYWQYSLPLMSAYFLFEFTRCAFIKRIWSSNGQNTNRFYKIFNLFFRCGSFAGKSSTNFIQTTKYWIFPMIILMISVFVATVYVLQRMDGLKQSVFIEFMVKNVYGHWAVFILVALPLGIAYGSTCMFFIYVCNCFGFYVLLNNV